MARGKLKIFSDKQYLPDGINPEPVLYPFWGQPPKGAGDEGAASYEAYLEQAPTFLEMAPLEEADVAILPANWERLLRLTGLFGKPSKWGGPGRRPRAAPPDCPEQQSARRFLEMARAAGKVTISFFSANCSHFELPFSCDLVFRESPFRSLRTASDFALPSFRADLLARFADGRVQLRPHRKKPVVGFCGFAERTSFRTLAKVLGYRFASPLMREPEGIPPYHVGHVIRYLALRSLRSDPHVEKNFIERDRAFFMTPDADAQQRLQREYVRNLIDCDYVLCIRGAGNNSYRFYEALCCGRIPVFVDTDCVLPYDFEVDWRRYCVFVPERDLDRIGEYVADFHARLNERDFQDLQREARALWQRLMTPEAFFQSLFRHVEAWRKEKVDAA